MLLNRVFAGKDVVGRRAVIHSQSDSDRSSGDVALTIEVNESIGESGRDGATRLTIARIGQQGLARSLKDVCTLEYVSKSVLCKASMQGRHEQSDNCHRTKHLLNHDTLPKFANG